MPNSRKPCSQKCQITASPAARSAKFPQALQGTISQVIEGQKSFDLFLWFDEGSRRDTQAMRGVLIDGHNGLKVPLSQLAEVSLENRPYFINRERVQRRIVVQASGAFRMIRPSKT